MKIAMLRGIGVATAMLLASCGDSTGPAADRNTGGNGSSTLLVKADVDASDVPGGFVTDFFVDVHDALDNPVTGASVTITNPTLGCGHAPRGRPRRLQSDAKQLPCGRLRAQCGGRERYGPR